VYQRALRHADGNSVSLSAGLVTHTTGPLDLPRLMQAADEALYRAKQQGRNRIENADIAGVSDV
jgi:PleD family two-component response regulator